MPAVAETFSLGSPVEIGRIEKELKKLWADSEGVMTRASLVNLAVYSDKQGSLGKSGNGTHDLQPPYFFSFGKLQLG